MGYSQLRGRLPTRYSPVRHFTQDRSPFRVRLACVRHAASVCSEPGSNSPVLYPSQSLQTGLLSKSKPNKLFGPLVYCSVFKDQKPRSQPRLAHQREAQLTMKNTRWQDFFSPQPRAALQQAPPQLQRSASRIIYLIGKVSVNKNISPKIVLPSIPSGCTNKPCKTIKDSVIKISRAKFPTTVKESRQFSPLGQAKKY